MFSWASPYPFFLEASEKIIIRERNRYAKFLEAGERYAAKNNLILGGKSGLSTLFGEPIVPDSFYMLLFTDSPAFHAKGLADECFRIDEKGERTQEAQESQEDPLSLGFLTNVITRVPEMVYSVMVDSRELFTLKSIPTYGGISTSNVLNFMEVRGRFSGESVRVMGINIQLIETYKNLTSLDRAASWGKDLAVEKRLRGEFLKRKGEYITTELVGGRSTNDGIDVNLLVETLVNKFLDETKIVVGEAVCRPGRRGALPSRAPPPYRGRRDICPYSYGPPARHRRMNRIQVIASRPLKEEEKELVEIAESLGAVSWIQIVYGNPNIPTEQKLRKFTLKARNRSNGNMESVMDVFNLGEYEVLPSVRPGDYRKYLGESEHGFKVGTFPLLLRMQFIDMWTIRFLILRKSISEEFGKNRIDAIFRDMLILFEGFDSFLADASADPRLLRFLFPTDSESYIGFYIDPAVSEKRFRHSLFRSKKLTFGKYFPAIGHRPKHNGGVPEVAPGLLSGQSAPTNGTGSPAKYAYVVMLLFTDAEEPKFTKRDRYALGGCMLAQSIKDCGGTKLANGDTADVVCMYTGRISDDMIGLLNTFFDEVRNVPEISRPVISNVEKTRFRDRYADWLNSSFTKINCLTFTEYEKVLFLDADMLCLRDPSGVFGYDVPAGVCSAVTDQDAMDGKLIPKSIVKKSLLGYANFGMAGCIYLFEPSTEKFDEAMALLAKYDEKNPYTTFKIVKQYYNLSVHSNTPAGPDEVFITLLYSDWHHIHSKYAKIGWKREADTAVIHFVTMKPWDEIEKAHEPVYPDFEIWYEFTSGYLDKHPFVRKLILSGDHGEKILGRIVGSAPL